MGGSRACSFATRCAGWRRRAASRAGRSTAGTGPWRPCSRAAGGGRVARRFCRRGPEARGRARRGARGGARGPPGLSDRVALATRNARHRRGEAPTIAGMPELSRSQLLVYAAIAVALLLVGARWLRSDADPGAAGCGRARGRRRGLVRGRARGRGSRRARRGRGARPRRLPAPAGIAGHRRHRARGRRDLSSPADGINLAAELADGQQVVLPSRSPTGAAPPARPRPRGRSASARRPSSSSTRSRASGP